jgi:hypothetical protein
MQQRLARNQHARLAYRNLRVHAPTARPGKLSRGSDNPVIGTIAPRILPAIDPFSPSPTSARTRRCRKHLVACGRGPG